METTPMRIGADKVLTDEVSEVRSPYDGSLVGIVPAGDAGHLDTAVALARARLAEGSLPAHERAAILDRAAVAVADRQEQFAQLIARESAKPIKTARVEAARAVDTFRFSAGVARTLTGETVPMDASPAGADKLAFVMRVPVGVVAAISPFNFPLNLVVHKVAPAIASGCPVVLKPASATPLTALALAEVLIDECGLPPGWLHVVTCPGKVADHLVTHDHVAMITFTGSPAVGWSIRERAPRKKVSLELGNNSPVIVEADGDWQAAAAKIAVAGYSYAGQSCISVQRVYVHSSIAEPFTEALTAEVESLVVGDPLDDRTDVSALITRDETERVAGWVDEARREGAVLRTGGDITETGVLRPTVLADVEPDMEISRTEVFGPVVGVQAYERFDDALALANDSRYGLQAGVFTADVTKALSAARTLDFGGVLVNEVPTWRADQMPYGGLRDSGNTREGPAYTAREMTVERLIVLHG